jgi:hypothetical protein
MIVPTATTPSMVIISVFNAYLQRQCLRTNALCGQRNPALLVHTSDTVATVLISTSRVYCQGLSPAGRAHSIDGRSQIVARKGVNAQKSDHGDGVHRNG